ncbi:hypothetical protein TNCV_4855971 [Trichonephila clavipes]|nr:hypothetical protein TNCV_4855971 [Trichonephila clavipes]
MREEGRNHLVPGPDFLVHALKLPNLASRVYGESLQKRVAWCCPGSPTPLLLANSDHFRSIVLASNGPVVDSRNQNLVFGHAEATPNKLFLSNPTKYTVELSWPLLLVCPSFELLHRHLTTIIFAQY